MMRMAIPIPGRSHELVALQRNCDSHGLIRRVFREALFKAQDFTHTTEVDNPVGSSGERNDVLDRTTDLHSFRADEKDSARTYVPGGPNLGNFLRTGAYDFQR